MLKFFMSGAKWSGLERMEMPPSRRLDTPLPKNRSHQRRAGRYHQRRTVINQETQEGSV